MKNILLILSIILSVQDVCYSQQNDLSYFFAHDTLSAGSSDCKNNHLIDNYYEKFGIKVSNYFALIDSVRIDINRDKKNDWVLVFSPITQENKDTLPCEANRGKRLLVLLLSTTKTGFSVAYINENVILNPSDYQNDPFKGIKKSKNGISILFETGSIIYCEYKFSFLIKRNTLILNKRETSYFNKRNPEHAVREFKNFTMSGEKNDLKFIDINNFLISPNL